MYNSVYCVGTIYVAFHSHVFYDVPWVLIADARSFHDFAAISDSLTHLVSISSWYLSDDRQEELRLPQAALL